MARKWRYVLTVAAALLSIPAVFVLAFVGLSQMVQAEYASGERVSTAGDTVTIPAVGITAAWVVALAIAAVVVLGVRMLRRKRG